MTCSFFEKAMKNLRKRKHNKFETNFLKCIKEQTILPYIDFNQIDLQYGNYFWVFMFDEQNKEFDKPIPT